MLANRASRRRFCAAVVAAAACVAARRGGAGEPPEVAGTVRRVRGQCWVSVPGQALRRLRNDNEIRSGERVITGRNASLTLRFADDTELALGAQTIVNIDAFRFGRDTPGDTDTMQTTIAAGVVRAITGLLARRRPSAVRFGTPAATIGVRGTHFLTEVEGEQVTVILLEQDDAAAPNAVDVANAAGSVTVDQPEFGTVVANANTAPTPVRRMQVDTVDRLLRNVRAARRLPTVRVPTP